MIARLRSCPQIECGIKVMEYEVRPGDTVVSGIAAKFGIDEDTIRWRIDLTDVKTIKPGQLLRILPVVGIAHKVSRGETIYSSARNIRLVPRELWTFRLIYLPMTRLLPWLWGECPDCSDGKKLNGTPGTPICMWRTPNAGEVSATGQFIWPLNYFPAVCVVPQGIGYCGSHGDAGAGTQYRTDNGERLAG